MKDELLVDQTIKDLDKIVSIVCDATELSDAKLIVPTESLWAGIRVEAFSEAHATLSWNDMLSSIENTLDISDVVIGDLQKVNKKGYVCRPLDEYKNYKNRPLYILHKKDIK